MGYEQTNISQHCSMARSGVSCSVPTRSDTAISILGFPSTKTVDDGERVTSGKMLLIAFAIVTIYVAFSVIVLGVR